MIKEKGLQIVSRPEVEANEPLTVRHKAWLKSLRKVKLAPDAEMTGHLQRMAQSNPLFARRS